LVGGVLIRGDALRWVACRRGPQGFFRNIFAALILRVLER
jgi:hypothetical protein